jgi:hypothetical protein
MPVASGRMELWRRIALLFGILVGIGLFFYVTPSIVKVTAVDWQKEHAGELRSISGYVSSEKKRLNQLPLEDYINEKTGGKVTLVDAGQWKTFFHEVQLASNGEYARSIYGNRVSPEDKDDFWKPTGPVPVFFKPDEFPFAQWGLSFESGKRVYIRTNEGTNSYLLLEYEDYHSELSAMYTPYRLALLISFFFSSACGIALPQLTQNLTLLAPLKINVYILPGFNFSLETEIINHLKSQHAGNPYINMEKPSISLNLLFIRIPAEWIASVTRLKLRIVIPPH